MSIMCVLSSRKREAAALLACSEVGHQLMFFPRKEINSKYQPLQERTAGQDDTEKLKCGNTAMGMLHSQSCTVRGKEEAEQLL